MEIKGYLTLIGESFCMEDVTARLKTIPDTIRKPDEILNNGQCFGHCEWGLQTETIQTDEVESLLVLLRSRLNCSTQDMRKTADELGAEWHNLYYLRTEDTETPCIILSSDSIRFLSEIGASVGFDNYHYLTVKGVLRYFFRKNK